MTPLLVLHLRELFSASSDNPFLVVVVVFVSFWLQTLGVCHPPYMVTYTALDKWRRVMSSEKDFRKKTVNQKNYIYGFVTLQGSSTACSVYDTLFNSLTSPLCHRLFRISPNMKNGFQYARSFKSNSDRKIAGEIEKNEVWFFEAIIDQLLVAFTPCPRQCM